MKFEIGQEVQWEVGKIKSIGCFLFDNNDGTSTVVLHMLNGAPCGREVKVNNELIKLKTKI